MKISIAASRAAAAASLALAATAALAQPETVSDSAVLSEGVQGSPENTVLQHIVAGGFQLGRVDISGTLAAIEPETWRIDSRIIITAPNGEAFDLHPFADGTTFSSASFSTSHFFSTVGDPAGVWTFRYYELIDDEQNGAVADAAWTNITFTFTDEPPQPPVATDLGTLISPGTSPAASQLNAGQVKWFHFQLTCPLQMSLGTFLDVETDGSTFGVSESSVGNGDSMVALFDASGSLVASDDDDGPGLTAQLTFGAGTRPPLDTGQLRDGADGPLPPGDYYLAAGGYPLRFSGEPWGVEAPGSQDGTLHIQFDTNAGTLAADFNADGAVDVFDLLDYLDGWFSMNPSAERTGDSPSQVNVFDLLDYLSLWFGTAGHQPCS